MAVRGRSAGPRVSTTRKVFLLAAGLIAAATGYAVANSDRPTATSPQLLSQATTALRHLVGPPESITRLTPFVQAINGQLANAIAAAAVQSPSDDSNLMPDGSVSISTTKVVSPGVASVEFGISDTGNDGYVQRFVGNVVLSDGRWKVSWATVCMLVEAESYVCPNPPQTLSGAVPLPHSLLSETQLAHEEPDLIRPQALAVEPNGDLLIVDTDRNQILRWQPDGHLSVFAGTGQPGLGGIGGLAVDARLPSYFGSQLAVAKNGTVYVTGGSACGLFVITPSGLLERTLTRLCNISGVTISASGALYVADDTAAYRASSSGALTEVARNENQQANDAPKGVPSAIGFAPSLLAFAGNGDLDIYSDGPRGIWQLTTNGTLTDIGMEYADGMAAAPDGSVLLAGHGGSIDRVTASGAVTDINLLSAKIAGYGVPGMRGGFQPNGIAVASDGTIFADTFSGNGWTDATSVAEIPVRGEPRQIPITTPLLDTLPRSGAPSSPAARYPAPIAAHGADLSSCPSPKGLVPFNATALAASRHTAARFNAYVSSFWGDLASSDRTWWTHVFDEWSGSGYDNDTHTVEAIGPASRDTFAPVVAEACGQQLVNESEVVVEGPSAYSFQVTHVFFLDRDGHPLVYFQAS